MQEPRKYDRIGTTMPWVPRSHGKDPHKEGTNGFYLYIPGRGFSPGISCLARTQFACAPRAVGRGCGRIYTTSEQPGEHGLAQTPVRWGLGGLALAHRVWWTRGNADGAGDFY